MNATEKDFLSDELSELMSYVDQGETLNEGVSKAKVSWHIAHSLKTVNEIVKSMKASDPTKFENSFSGIRAMSLTFNYIPRGRAQSPQSVRPPEEFGNELIQAEFNIANQNLEEVFNLDKSAYFEHPVFGNLKRAQALRFIEVHTKHHLKIIKDIVGK